METLKHIALYQLAGAPAWVWLATLVGLPLLNELVSRSNARAQSLFQAIGNALKASPLYAIPLVKQLADIMATPTKPAVNLDAAQVQPQKGRAAALLPLLFGLALGGTVSGCAWAKCELGHLPATAQAVIATVVGIASNSDHYVDDLLSLGKQIGPSQLDCVVTALVDNAAATKARASWSTTVTGRLSDYLVVRRSMGAKLECAPPKTAYRLSPLAWPKGWEPAIASAP